LVRAEISKLLNQPAPAYASESTSAVEPTRNLAVPSARLLSLDAKALATPIDVPTDLDQPSPDCPWYSSFP
jgi:hypothetical protein